MILLASIADDAAQIAEKFGFQPQIFASQVVSFLIVCALLYKFAYGPVQQMLDQRRKTIEDGQKNALAIREQLAATEKRVSEMLIAANTKDETMLTEAKESAHALSERERQATIAEATQLIEKAQEAARQASEIEMRKLKGEVGRLVIETTAKVIGREISTADQERLSRETAAQIGA